MGYGNIMRKRIHGTLSKFVFRMCHSQQFYFSERKAIRMPTEFLGVECVPWFISQSSPGDQSAKTWWRITHVRCLALLVALAIGGLGYYESTTSRGQAQVFHWISSHISYELQSGKRSLAQLSTVGPFDQRRGYSRLTDMIPMLEEKGFHVQSQAQASPWLQGLVTMGLPAIYSERDQAGLKILDRNGQSIFQHQVPQRAFADFQSIPSLIVRTLLFIENRELLDPCCSFANPAVEWDRVANALLQKGIQMVVSDHRVPGGSTLATQLEKFRHFPEGRTVSVEDKFRQMGGASLRAYLQGPQTITARQQLVLHYLNSFPLGGAPGMGEIFGLGDGLWTWYGRELDSLARDLEGLDTQDGGALYRGAATYKKVLSLLLALRRPSYYMEHPDALDRLANQYLLALAEANVISHRVRDAARGYPLIFWTSDHHDVDESFVERKGQNFIRVHLQHLLGVESLYNLDRLDLTVQTTLDHDLQARVSAFLKTLHSPNVVSALGLKRPFLVGQGNPSGIVYSVSLYERTPEGNLLRAQTDTFNQPLDINLGSKMDLGSTAKLRTLINYLEVIEQLHHAYALQSSGQLQDVNLKEVDPLSRWAVSYFRTSSDKSLEGMLSAALARQYSASPHESFLTGGGVHRFANFDSKDNGRILMFDQAFERSVNLVFIRLMRDIVQYYMLNGPGSAVNVLKNRDHPARHDYLVKFAKQEGRVFLRTFFKKYQGMDPDQAFAYLLQGRRLTPKRLAVLVRTIQPETDVAGLTTILRATFPLEVLSSSTIVKLYESFGPGKFSLADHAYLARIHPLELWTLGYLRSNPKASLSEVFQAGEPEVVNVYAWLFRTNRIAAQDKRIQFILEQEAFLNIHQAWQRLGYPFGHLVPSYATAIGSSADRPAALSEIMGILLNDGRRAPMVHLQRLHFAEGTPYDTVMVPHVPRFSQVLHPTIAGMVRKVLVGVVENGTAKRALQSLKDHQGVPVVVSGKTGTGDHRFKVFGRGVQLLESRVVSRTATFVFAIGDRFFGTITAQVSGREAGAYGFTSSLPVEIFRLLTPEFALLVNRPHISVAQTGASMIKEL